MDNFKKLIKEAYLGNPLDEDRKAIEYIKSISDPEEREAEKKRMFGDDELDEATDFNDPALMAARAAQMADEKEKARQAALDKKYGSTFMDKLDAELDLKAELEDLNHEREMLMIDMEEEAEPEGGEIADRYGERLNQIDQRIADIQEELDDLRMYESVNEESEGDKEIKALEKEAEKYSKTDSRYMQIQKKIGNLKSDKDYALPGSKADKKFSDMNEDRFKKNEDSYIRITEPRFKKDPTNPNFLFGYINYDTGPGVGMALGKETMAGQIRRLSSAEAVRQLENIGRKLSDSFDLEDLDIVDLENGVVELFAVSDDFVDMDPRSELSTAMLNEEFKVGDKVTYLGHPAVVTATKEYNGRDFVSVSYDKGNGATKARMILVKSGDVKAVKEGTCGYTPDGEPRSKPAGPVGEEKDTDVGGGAEQDNRDYNFSDADDGAYAEEHSGVVGENKEFDFKKMVKEALTPDYLKK